MTSALYDVYHKGVFRLAKTMVIKHSDIARTINANLRLAGHTVDPDAPQTWRYYMHLAGEYHSGDEPMYITDLDSVGGGTVLLTKTFLETNRITRESYQYGTRFYDELVQRFPAQETLIRGMLNPIHINAAISAPDGAILYYDPTLVEEYEVNLIPELQQWVENYFAQRYIRDYLPFNNRYLQSVLGTLYAFLAPMIFEIRLRNCHTDYVHSYHVTQFLESHGRLGKYIPFMSRRTMMYLYRNIRWIRKHAGKQIVFERLIANIMTRQNLPLSEYDMIRTVSVPTDITGRLDWRSNPYPNVQMLPRSLNYRSGEDTTAFVDVADIIEKQSLDIPMTDEQKLIALRDTRLYMRSHNKNELKTKVMESIVNDETNSVPYPLTDVLADHLVYYAMTDRFQSNITFVNPSNSEQVIMSVKNALYLYTYCIHTYYNDMVPPDELGRYVVLRAWRSPSPTRAQLANAVPVDHIPPKMLARILDHDIYVPVLNTTERFYDHVMDVQAFMLRQHRIHSMAEHIDHSAWLRKVAGMHYGSYEFYPEPGKLYTDWLSENNIVLDGLGAEDMIRLADMLLALMTGAGSNASRSLREMHRAMINLMRDLSSYSVQYLRSITNENVYPLVWQSPRLDPMRESVQGTQWVELRSPYVVTAREHDHSRYHYALDRLAYEPYYHETLYALYSSTMDATIDDNTSMTINVNYNHFGFTGEDFLVDLSGTSVTDVQEYHNP